MTTPERVAAPPPADTPRGVPALRAAGRYLKRRPWLTAPAGLIGVGGALAFVNIIEDVLTGDSTAMDHLLLRRSHLLATSSDGQWVTPLAHFASLMGNWQVLLPLAALLLFLAWRGRAPRRAPAFYALALAGAGLLILAAKYAVNRPRQRIVPALEAAPFASFPSGHTAYALVAYGFLAFLVWRETRLPLWAKTLTALAALTLVGLIGLSRVYLGAHYPSDVVAGFLLGVPWLIAVCAWYERGASPAPTAAAHAAVR